MYPEDQQSSTSTSLAAENLASIHQLEDLVAAGRMDRSSVAFARKRLKEKPLDKLIVHIRPDGETGFWYTISTDDPAKIGAETEAWLKTLSNPQPGDFTSEDYAQAGSYVGADGVLRTPIEESYEPEEDEIPPAAAETVTVIDAPERGESDYTGAKRMACRFVDIFKGHFIHTPGQGWMKYNGSHWETCSDVDPWNAVEVVCRQALMDAAHMHKSDRSDLLKVIAACESESGTKSVLAHVRRWTGIAMRDDQLDSNPGLFAVRNGVIDLYNGGTFRPASPWDLLTMHGNVDYNPDATCPTYDRLMALYQPDKKIRAYMHRLAGAAMEGTQNLQNLIVWFGETAGNGKGTTERMWTRVFGTYAKRLPVEVLVARGKYDQYKDEKAKLRGARLVFTTEPEEGMRFSAGTLNNLTGKDPITSREVYKSSVTFEPTWLIMMSTNARVSVSRNLGNQRRLKEIPWEYMIPRDKMDDTIENQLAAETSGVLNHFIAGWLDFRKDGIRHPESVEEATKDYFRSVDPICRFIDECLEPHEDPEHVGPTKERMYRLYVHWCKEAGERFVETKAGFGRALKKPHPQGPGMHDDRTGSMRYWKGYDVGPDYQDSSSDMWAGTSYEHR